ncbi:hypothetical protein P863_18285 [Mycobacterium avium subsp. silvaticum ATCC 49884]|nr:hypothetical protein P863_18285 [Mycobacterium avium subsp. silvaticum ATCC 49884]
MGGVRAGGQGRRKRHGQFALRGVQVAVARRHRQAVGLPHGRHPDHLHVDVEVGDHLTDHHQLLVVLLAEEDSVGAHDLQQLAHDGQHAGEMRRPGPALQLGGQRAGLHGGAQTIRVHRRGRWGEGDFDALGAQ